MVIVEFDMSMKIISFGGLCEFLCHLYVTCLNCPYFIENGTMVLWTVNAPLICFSLIF